MQNRNLFNAGYSMNTNRMEALETRSFSPNFGLLNSLQGVGSDVLPTSQYLQNAQNTNSSVDAKGNFVPDERGMSSLLDRVFTTNMPPQMQPQSSTPAINLPRNHPINEFNEQYNRLQQARMQQQMLTHNEAMMRKQQTFAMRQMMNPPTMSRQASAINLHQVNTSTQTTPNAQHSQLFQSNFGLNNQSGYPDIMRANGMNNFNTDASLTEDLAKAYINSKRSMNLNPFIRETDLIQSNNDERCDSGAQSPVHQSYVYKEPSSSSATSTPTKLLKSPKTKRQPTSLVTFSGWLYKQGSEGLKSWRRRWFVLSDYCLFYYKGPEEDKLLGSILLPSYVLSECLPSENKAYRKFSFKLEHKNMRTYYLASENGDYMRKWMKVIRAATLMQNVHEIQTRKMLASSTPISTSMLTGYDQSYKYKSQTDHSYRKADIHPTLNPFLIFDEDNNERQPLYVNAPPKPRRVQSETEYPLKPNDAFMFPYNTDTSAESTPIRLLENEDIELNNSNQFKRNQINCGELELEVSSAAAIDKNRQKVMPPRPHSADFLEYESRRQFRRFKDFSLSGAYTERLPYRPKSSLDINSSTDNYYYSEASYAAKMRQSAAYLQNHNQMANRKNESKLSTLRYENDRKRLTNEFNNYTANYLVNNRWASTLPKMPPKTNTNNNSWRFSTVTRNNHKNVDYSPNMENRYFSDLEMRAAAAPECFNSSEMINDDDTERNDNRFDDRSGLNNVWSPDISAGTLLSKTHEELVLLLIQLRRQNDIREKGLCRRMKDMDAIQNRLKNEEATAVRLELMGKLEILREEVNKLEQQYEKTKPLVNLVDNMVKLGSLYRVGSMQWDMTVPNAGTLNRLRTNQKDVERRAQVDDERQWNKYNPSQIELQHRIEKLYELDQRLQDESNNLQILQQDKYDIESTLEELNHRFATNQIAPENYIASQKIHRSLQLELCKVHSELAEHSRRLEITVSQNTKLERELLVLRQKWQASRDKSNASLNHMSYGNQINETRTVDAFESELRKVRDSVGDMKRQRDELSMAVSQITLDSQEPIDQGEMYHAELNANPFLSKRIETNWVETDIDSMQKKNAKNVLHHSAESDQDSYYYMEDMNSGDDHWHDKQEIKTVRIVKRESERRHREKDKSNFEIGIAGSASNQRESNASEKNNYPFTFNDDSRINVFQRNEPSTSKARPTIRNQKNSKNNVCDNIFQSNTAKEILNEMSNGNVDQSIGARAEMQMNVPEVCKSSQNSQFKRITPRKKKRHNTAPTSENFLDYMAERDSYKYSNQRARDDLDMEVVLRSNPQNENAISGPPDIVRSALGSNSEYLFD